jgi:Dolichyl-phosphate-mannose-protein mannosyltransferase
MLALILPAILLFAFGRAPSLSNDFCDPDLAGISYGARDLLDGGTIYDRCVETKPPGAYLIFATSFGLFGRTLIPIYVLAALLHLLALGLLARLAHRAAGPMAAVFAAWFYACLAIDTAAAAGCPNYDTWMILFVVYGFAALEEAEAARRPGWLAGAGALLGAAFLMKQQAALFVGTAGLWVLLTPTETATRRMRRAAYLAAGVAAPLAIIAVWWAVIGGLGTMLADLHPARLSNYVGAGSQADALAMAWERAQEHLAGAWPMWLAVLAGVALAGRSAGRRLSFARHGLLLATAVAAVLVGSRFYKHYLIILSGPLALVAGHAMGLVEQALAGRRWRYAIYALVFAALGMTIRTELAQSTMALQAWAHGDGLITGEMLYRFTRDDVNLETRHDDATLQDLGAYIASVTPEGATIYVWPYNPQVYFWADRDAPTKHYMYFEVAANLPYKFGGWHGELTAPVVQNRRRLMADLQAARPAFVVLPGDRHGWNQAFDDLEAWVAENYVLDPRAPGEQLRVYRLP